MTKLAKGKARGFAALKILSRIPGVRIVAAGAIEHAIAAGILDALEGMLFTADPPDDVRHLIDPLVATETQPVG